MKELKTKLPAYVHDEHVGDYTAFICKDKKGRVILRIVPCAGTAGYWTYYLESLLHINGWSGTRPSDNLCIDLNRGWGVKNMHVLFKEIINNCIGVS